MECNRDFKGVWIPERIWVNTNLSAIEKLLYGLILLHETERGCDLSNRQLAEELNCSESTISKTIAKLKSKGFLIELSFDGRVRVVMTN